MSRRILVSMFVVAVTGLGVWLPGDGARASDAEGGAIDLAIALDTSASMKPLIDAARLTLWDVVNELTFLDPPPQLRVALLSYGNKKNDPAKGWVRVEAPLTADLDYVYERLFRLETNGGYEFVGRVLQTAVEELAWTDAPEAVKLVFIAGNESAEQDPKIDSGTLALDALGKDLLVHAVFCGAANHPDAETWTALAEMARGRFAAIDHRSAARMVETPLDAAMTDLGAELNHTYVPLGEAGREGLAAQATQDENALSVSPAAAAARAETKAGPLYSPEWDLVEALQAGRIELDQVDEADLPEVMREMTQLEREDYLGEQLQRRQEIRRQILELGAQRRNFVSEQVEKKGLDDSRSFDGVIRRAILEQVAESGFRSSQEP